MVPLKKLKKLNKLGKVTKPHGLEGFFYFKLKDSCKEGDILFVGKDEHTPTPAVVKSLKIHKGKTLVKLSLALDRTALEPYLGSCLWEEVLDIEGLPEEECKGKIVKTSDDLELGICQGSYNCGAGDVIVIQREDGFLLELPFNNTYFEKKAIILTKFPKSFFAELWQKS